MSIEARGDQVYTSMLLKQNWATFDEVLDTSEYIKKVSGIIQARVLEVKTALNSVYVNLFINKLVVAMCNQFLANIYKIKRCNETSSHQF
jgi:hypothetical protein